VERELCEVGGAEYEYVDVVWGAAGFTVGLSLVGALESRVT
jgi:hypothetical protein